MRSLVSSFFGWLTQATLGASALIAAVFIIAFFIDYPLTITLLPLSVGVYIWVRGEKAFRNEKEDTRRKRLLSSLDEVAAIATIVPGIFLFLAGLGVIAFRVLFWLLKADWPVWTFQTAFHWPLSVSSITTGALGFDRITSWLLTEAPLELWFMIVFPAIWVLLASKAKYVIPAVAFVAVIELSRRAGHH